MAGKARAKAWKKSKKVMLRILTIVVVAVMAGGILLATLIFKLY
jgi:hypothetical protein